MGFVAKFSGVLKNCTRFINKKTLAFFAGFLALGAFAQEPLTTYSPVEKGEDGAITFTPTNIINPIVDGVVDSYAAWAVLVVIIIVVGLMVWIFKKK